jgi:hypothetical protein
MTSDAMAAQTAASTADSKEQPTSLFNNVPWPFRPSPGINYNFVTTMYLSGTAIAVLFYLLEKQILAPLLAGDDEKSSDTSSIERGDEGEKNDLEGGGEAWKEFARGMLGMHFIFDPFIPCLFWSMIVRHYWLKKTDLSSQAKKEN